MTTLQQDALRIYDEIPPGYRNHVRWVLSKDTMEALAGCELKDENMEGACLIGHPIRRDDSVDYLHLSFELL